MQFIGIVMKTEEVTSKFMFSYIIIVFLIISIISPAYSMETPDEENEDPHYFSFRKLESDSDEDSNDTNFSSSAEDERIAKLVRAESWGPTAERLLIKAVSTGGQLNPLEHKNDLIMLLDVAKTGTTSPETRPTLATVLTFFEHKEAKEATDRLHYIIALDNSLPLEVKKNALEDLEHSDLTENKDRVYEVRTTLAKDKSLPPRNRYKFASGFLYSHEIEDLKHAIKLFKEILANCNYNEKVSSKILSKLNFAYSTDWPDLYKYAQIKILKVLGCRKSFSIMQRYLWLYRVMQFAGESNISTNKDESEVEKEVYKTIKHKISEGEFKNLVRSKLSSLSEDKLQGSFRVIENFYNAPDTELPMLRGNLNSLLNLIGFDFCKEYEEAKKRIENRYNIDFFSSMKNYKPAKRIWDSIIEDARQDAQIMQELKEFLPNIEMYMGTTS